MEGGQSPDSSSSLGFEDSNKDGNQSLIQSPGEESNEVNFAGIEQENNKVENAGVASQEQCDPALEETCLTPADDAPSSESRNSEIENNIIEEDRQADTSLPTHGEVCPNDEMTKASSDGSPPTSSAIAHCDDIGEEDSREVENSVEGGGSTNGQSQGSSQKLVDRFTFCSCPPEVPTMFGWSPSHWPRQRPKGGSTVPSNGGLVQRVILRARDDTGKYLSGSEMRKFLHLEGASMQKHVTECLRVFYGEWRQIRMTGESKVIQCADPGHVSHLQNLVLAPDENSTTPKGSKACDTLTSEPSDINNTDDQSKSWMTLALQLPFADYLPALASARNRECFESLMCRSAFPHAASSGQSLLSSMGSVQNQVLSGTNVQDGPSVQAASTGIGANDSSSAAGQTPDPFTVQGVGPSNASRFIMTLKSVSMGVETVEPLFCSMFIVHLGKKCKVTETFHCDINDEEALLQKLGRHLPVTDVLTRAKSALFTVSRRSERLWLVVMVSKVLGHSTVKYYTKGSAQDIESAKQKANVNCKRNGKYRQPLAWAATKLFGPSGDLLSGEQTLSNFQRVSTDISKPFDVAEGIRDLQSGRLRTERVAGSVCLNFEDWSQYRIKQNQLVQQPHYLWVSPSLTPVEHFGSSSSHSIVVIREVEELPSARRLAPHTSYINTLYVWPKAMNMVNLQAFSAPNLVIRCAFKKDDDNTDTFGSKVMVTQSSNKESLATFCESQVAWACETPEFHDEFKVLLPPRIPKRGHLLFTFIDVGRRGVMDRLFRRDDVECSETIVGYSFQRLMSQSDRLLTGDKMLPVYLKLEKGYLNPDVRKRLPVMDRGDLLFDFLGTPLSTVHPQDTNLVAFFRAVGSTSTDVRNPAMRDNIFQGLLNSVEGLKNVSTDTAVQFFPVVCNHLLDVARSAEKNSRTAPDSDKLWSQLGASVVSAILHLASIVSSTSGVSTADPSQIESFLVSPRPSVLLSYIDGWLDNLESSKQDFSRCIANGLLALLDSDNAGDSGIGHLLVSEGWFLLSLLVKTIGLSVAPLSNSVESGASVHPFVAPMEQMGDDSVDVSALDETALSLNDSESTAAPNPARNLPLIDQVVCRLSDVYCQYLVDSQSYPPPPAHCIVMDRSASPAVEEPPVAALAYLALFVRDMARLTGPKAGLKLWAGMIHGLQQEQQEGLSDVLGVMSLRLSAVITCHPDMLRYNDMDMEGDEEKFPDAEVCAQQYPWTGYMLSILRTTLGMGSASLRTWALDSICRVCAFTDSLTWLLLPDASARSRAFVPLWPLLQELLYAHEGLASDILESEVFELDLRTIYCCSVILLSALPESLTRQWISSLSPAAAIRFIELLEGVTDCYQERPLEHQSAVSPALSRGRASANFDSQSRFSTRSGGSLLHRMRSTLTSSSTSDSSSTDSLTSGASLANKNRRQQRELSRISEAGSNQGSPSTSDADWLALTCRAHACVIKTMLLFIEQWVSTSPDSADVHVELTVSSIWEVVCTLLAFQYAGGITDLSIPQPRVAQRILPSLCILVEQAIAASSCVQHDHLWAQALAHSLILRRCDSHPLIKAIGERLVASLCSKYKKDCRRAKAEVVDTDFSVEDSASNIRMEGGLVTAASITKLIEKLTHPFAQPEVFYPDYFLMTYKTFTEPWVLMMKLVQRYVSATKLFESTHSKVTQLRVVNVMTQWVEKYFVDLDPWCISHLIDFIDEAVSKDTPNLVDKLLKPLLKRLPVSSSIEDSSADLAVLQPVVLSGAASSQAKHSTGRTDRQTTLSHSSSHSGLSHTGSTLGTSPSSVSSLSSRSSGELSVSSQDGGKTRSVARGGSVTNNASTPGSNTRASTQDQQGSITVPTDDMGWPLLQMFSFTSINVETSGEDTAAEYDRLEVLDAKRIAHYLTMNEFRLFSAIDQREFLGKAWQSGQKARDAPHIVAITDWFNKVSSWVVQHILERPLLRERRRVLTKLIDIAWFCKEMNNFNAVFEFTSAFDNAAISRLKKTWAEVEASSTSSKRLEELRELTVSDKNFKEFKERLRNINPPCIPFIGVFLTHLTFIEDGQPDSIDGLVYFTKRRQAGEIIKRLHLFQQVPYKFEPDDHSLEMHAIFSSMQDEQPTDAEIFARSLQVEPRET